LLGEDPAFRGSGCAISVPQSRTCKTISMTYVLVQSIPARTQRCITTRDRACIHVQLLYKTRTMSRYYTLLTICSMVRGIEMQMLCFCLLRTRRDEPGSHGQQPQQYSRNPHWKVTYLSLFFAYLKWVSQFHPGFPSFSIANTKMKTINNVGYVKIKSGYRQYPKQVVARKGRN
jgi:hypothetical protein